MKLAVVTFVIFSLACIHGMLISDTQRSRNELLPDSGNVTCVCNGITKTDMIPRDQLHKQLSDLLGSIFDTTQHPAMKECFNCPTKASFVARIISCNSTSRTNPCIEREVNLEGFSISNKDATGSKYRKRRRLEGVSHCNFPKNMKTSYMTCTEYPSSVKCNQKCIFGFTLDEGISREMKCSIKENLWKPHGFQECSPFVDCTMTLIATGWKSCRFGTIDTPSECNVTCGRYEDKDEFPMTNYICDVDKVWTKALPHCVVSGSGFATVTPPRIKRHTEAPPIDSQPRKQMPRTKAPEVVKQEVQKAVKNTQTTQNVKKSSQ